MSLQISFPGGAVDYHFHSNFELLPGLVKGRKVVLLTDSHVYALYEPLFQSYDTIVVPAGEAAKSLESLVYITEQLLRFDADRKTLLTGVGGGVVTDLAGFAASVYMRGIRFGFVPTSLLAMTDAAIGGKNGINIGLHKNMIGTIEQPEFILFDEHFLQTLPDEEWSNGFAEIIKYACIFDPFLFDELMAADIAFFRNNMAATGAVVRKCANWKNKTVLEDERETGARKLLNFGHTVGHAIEKLCEMPHGYAVSIGMLVACRISEQLVGLDNAVTDALKRLLIRYHLPTRVSVDSKKVMALLKADKKRNGEKIDLIFLEHIGRARIATTSFDTIEEILIRYLHAGDH